PLELPPVLASSPDSLLAVSPPEDAADSPPEVPFEVVEVLVVDVVWTEAFSALVSAGGGISGGLFGIAAEALLPLPQPARTAPPRSSRQAPRAAREPSGRRSHRLSGAGWAGGVSSCPLSRRLVEPTSVSGLPSISRLVGEVQVAPSAARR